MIIGLVLLMNCPGESSARQHYDSANNATDTATHSPAETILKMVSLHLAENNPSSFNSFSAIMLQKFRVKMNLSHEAEHLGIDSTEIRINQNNTKYLFSSEILTSQKQLKPGFSQSEKLSVKVTGKDDSTYTKLARSLNEFSILQPISSILNKNYLSPFSDAAYQNYRYTSSDSVTAFGDSLYRITFRPDPDKHFDGFSGTAVIDAKKWAIRQISAHSTQNDPQEPILVINENFERLNGFWLPSEKRIVVFINLKNNNQVNNLIAESTTNIYQQQINPPLSPYDFKNSLSPLITDSATVADNQDRQTKVIRMMAEGKISLGYFNLDYNKFFGYNLFEGIKLGMGGETNRLLSRHFTIGGYISYGLKDKSLRHGEWVNIYPSERSNLRIHVSYKDMNLEFGGPEFLEPTSLLNPESYRNLLIKNMFSTKRYSTGLEFRPSNEMDVYLFGDLSENRSRQNTSFLLLHPFNPISLTRTGLQLRFSPGIKLKMEDGRLDEVTAPKADYFLTIIQGLTIFSGEYKYTKLELKGKFNLPFSGIGTTTIMLRGGTMTKNAPIIELFNGYGSFAGKFSLEAPYSFATMQLNEFAAANYTAFHLRHNFSAWLFPDKFKTRPAFIFAQNIGIGQLNNQYLAQYNLLDYRKGFYESGFEVNNLLRMNYLSWGVGIYYRYGPYRFSSVPDNFAYKFGFIFKI
jgi:hypothetical protein